MSAGRQPRCSYTRDYRVAGLDYEIDVECPDPPTHAVLKLDEGSKVWKHHADHDGHIMYACDYCVGQRFSAERHDWRVEPLLAMAWVAPKGSITAPPREIFHVFSARGHIAHSAAITLKDAAEACEFANHVGHDSKKPFRVVRYQLAPDRPSSQSEEVGGTG